MNDPFENYWQTVGCRYEAGSDHRERARHAYEAGRRSVAAPGEVNWLEGIDSHVLEVKVEIEGDHYTLLRPPAKVAKIT